MSYLSPRQLHKYARADTPLRNHIHHTAWALQGIIFTMARLLFSLSINDGGMDLDGAVTLSGSQNEVFSVVQWTEEHLSLAV